MNISFVTSTRNNMIRFIILNILLLFTSVNARTSTSGVKIYLNKCCPTGSFVGTGKTCVNNTTTNTLSKIKIYDEDINLTGKLFEDVFTLIPHKFANNTFRLEVYDVITLKHNVYLTESGVIQVELPNAYNRWQAVPKEGFCIDSRNELEPRFWAPIDEMYPTTDSNKYITAATIVSCFFMLLVLLVYVILPELRNLCGLILMAYIASLLMAFLLLVVFQIPSISVPTNACLGLTSGIYFFFLAAFCWMSVMSYDMWWTFSSIMKARQQSRSGERLKFLMYCLYAWGVPFLMTIFLVVVNTFEDDMKHLPWFVTPGIPTKGCFLQGGEKLLYFYIPMLILIICNWMFYLMSAFHIWQLNRGTAVLDSRDAGNRQAHRAQMQRLMLYLKLSVVMGLSWLLEVVSFQYPGYYVWYISDGYNSLIGVAMFLIFVCKKKIWKKLCDRFKEKKTKLWVSKDTSCTKVYSSQENIALQSLVSSQPNGLNG